MLFSLFIGFLAGLFLFLVLFIGGNELLYLYFQDSSYVYEAQTPYIKDLETYIQKNDLTATNSDALKEWADSKKIPYFSVSRERVLLFDSYYSKYLVLKPEQSSILHYTWKHFHTVTFSDGDADVYIYVNFERKFYLAFYILSTFISMLLWLIIFILGVRKEVLYIQTLSASVSEIEGGVWDCEIPIRGTDELGNLAYALDQMRRTIIEKKQREKQLQDDQNELVLTMAHDLRTPLTSLMTFLEIMRRDIGEEEPIYYIEKCYTKAEEITNLSDQLFEYFLISTTEPPLLNPVASIEYSLGEYLSDFYIFVEANGYTIDAKDLHWKNDIHIQIYDDYMDRIITGLNTNVTNYADPLFPVKLSLCYGKSNVDVVIEYTKKETANYDIICHGMGIQNIQKMMEQMYGLCNTILEDQRYRLLLTFPIKK